MRHVLHSAGRGKRVARQLRNAYATFGHDLAHVASLNLAARLYGYRSWRECHAEVG
ncbi:glyoxalase superfamily protein, partial [Acinetobacter baumannii]